MESVWHSSHHGRETCQGCVSLSKLFDEIGTCPGTVPLQLYYLIIPCKSDHFEKKKFPLSEFCINVKPGIAPKWKNNISFFALLPSSGFEAIMPEYYDLQHQQIK